MAVDCARVFHRRRGAARAAPAFARRGPGTRDVLASAPCLDSRAADRHSGCSAHRAVGARQPGQGKRRRGSCRSGGTRCVACAGLRRQTPHRRGCTKATTALIADPDLDAVYNPLPNGLHGRWTRAALAAGKHVLCEKPFTANAAEAREIAELAANSDRVVMEAFHYRYHPLTLRVEEIIASGELGTLAAGGGRPVLPAAEVLRHSLQLFAGRWRDDGRRVLRGPHGPHVRRFNPGSRFGTGEIARSARSTGP